MPELMQLPRLSESDKSTNQFSLSAGPQAAAQPVDKSDGGADMRGLVLCIAATLSLGTAAAAQTTRPAAPAWSRVVEHLSAALSKEDPGELRPLLAEDAAIRGFGGRTTGPSALLSRTQQATLLMTRAYVHPPRRLAADVAEAFASTDLPDSVKRYMTPAETAMDAANDAARQWIEDALAAKAGDPVAVLVFWPADADERVGVGQSPPVLFVLVKGGAHHADPRIRSLVFGNPNHELR